MSGINEIKKKAKLSIDEMYDSQTVGNLDSQEENKLESKQTSQPTNQKAEKSANQPSMKLHNQQNTDEHSQEAEKEANQPPIQPEIQPNRTPSYQPITQTSLLLASKQQMPKMPTYKMTFNLTEDIFKAFNDLYATRMLKGRKTEKSEMICEAIQWLVRMENEANE